MNQTLAFIGAGHLTTALVGGLLGNHFDAQKIWLTDASLEKLQIFRDQCGAQITQNNTQAVAQADVVVLAVKPKHLRGVCLEIKDAVLQHRPLIISVAAGVTIQLLEHWLDAYPLIVRAMPNTPATVGAGATGLYAEPAVSVAQKEIAETIFRAVGMTLWVNEEQQLDVVCALSGCGPGYIFLLMESLEAAAEQHGLPKPVARLLTAQTFLGAARLALASESAFAELCQQVASPGGATERALQVLEQADIRQILANAITAAVRRSAEIARQLAG